MVVTSSEVRIHTGGLWLRFRQTGDSAVFHAAKMCAGETEGLRTPNSDKDFAELDEDFLDGDLCTDQGDHRDQC